VGVIAFCPLQQGLLTDKYLDGVPEDSRAANEHGFLKREAIGEAEIAKVKKLNEIAKKRGQTLAQMALSWVLREDSVTSALIGASRPQQIVENVAAAQNTNFSEDEISQIEDTLKAQA
jgi:L-glyceraldehyde 3-phosphate reductase